LWFNIKIITRYAGTLADMILPDGGRLQSGATKARGWVEGADDNGFYVNPARQPLFNN